MQICSKRPLFYTVAIALNLKHNKFHSGMFWRASLLLLSLSESSCQHLRPPANSNHKSYMSDNATYFNSFIVSLH